MTTLGQKVVQHTLSGFFLGGGIDQVLFFNFNVLLRYELLITVFSCLSDEICAFATFLNGVFVSVCLTEIKINDNIFTC